MEDYKILYVINMGDGLYYWSKEPWYEKTFQKVEKQWAKTMSIWSARNIRDALFKLGYRGIFIEKMYDSEGTES